MRTILLAACAAGCGGAAPAPAAPATPPAPTYAVHALPLPGATAGLFLDYIAYDRKHNQVWVPAGATGTVAVIDVATDTVKTVEGFKTKEIERGTEKRVVGPSSAVVAEGYVYVGDRASTAVCAVDASTLKRAECAFLPASPDGLAFVEGRGEVWVTTPGSQSLTILDVKDPQHPKAVEVMKLDGAPEGFAVDDARHLFFTNLEDKDRTLVINTATRGVVKGWPSGCGEAGPRGIAVDYDRKLVMVACPDHVTVFDEGGKAVGRLDTGAGVDNLDYVQATHRLYAAAGRAGTLTIAELSSAGALESKAVVKTAEGARNAVAAEGGKVYITDGKNGGVLVVTPSGPPAAR